jgi:Probable transposase
VSAVVLQQAQADLNAAYRNFFASIKGRRKGPKSNPPRFRSRKDHRQAIRFTANARFKVLPNGKLRLPKIGDVPVRWSRPLPSEPSSVTVVQDSAGRYFASFVIEAGPCALQKTESVIGIDLGLKHFAILSDGRKIASPRFLRRAEKKLRRAQRALSRKQEGSRNRDKARLKVAGASRAGGRRAAKLSPPALHGADPRQPSGRRRGSGGQGARPDPAGQIRPRRRMVRVGGDAGVQGPAARPGIHQDRPVRADHPHMLSMRD